jgi:tRNA pseudouridine65 synthase
VPDVQDDDAPILQEGEPGLPPWSGPPPVVELLHRDEQLVVVCKPPGLLVHRVPGSDERVALLQTVRDQVGQYLYPVHRLDRPASGVLAFGLTQAAAASLQAALESDESQKEYQTLVEGPCPARFESRRPLQAQSGKLQPAWTEFEALASVPGATLLRARLRTGRHHQVRRHLAHLGWPILGDTVYGRRAGNARLREAHGLQRLFLHAARLVVAHPTSGAPLDLRAPLPPDLRSVLASLGLSLPSSGQ